MYHYRITEVYHSGRKGDRGDPRGDSEHTSLLGCRCSFNPANVKHFQSVRLKLLGHPDYQWWDTSEVVQLSRDFKGNYILETINTIYVLQEDEKTGAMAGGD